MTRRLVAALAIFVGSVVGSVPVSAASSASSCQSWGAQPPAVGGGTNQLFGVAVPSRCSAWAVGYYEDTSASRFKTLIEHWNGRGWKHQFSPSPGDFQDELNAVEATSPRNAWAVGYFDNAVFHALVERWNGQGWKVQPSPSFYPRSSELKDVSATSAGNAWAVGDVTKSGVNRTLVEHWNGTAWKIQHSPNVGTHQNFLYGLSTTSATNAWAVGYRSNGSNDRTLILHWNGTAWRVQHSPNLGTDSNDLWDVVALSSTNAWAVGSYYDVSGPPSAHRYKTLILHWNGKAWKVQPSPSPAPGLNELFGVVAISSNYAWAVGDYNKGGTRSTLVLRWGGKSWKVVPSLSQGVASELRDVDAGAPDNVWAVGMFEYGPPQPFALHCC